MCYMVLSLIAITQQPQMFLSPPQMVFNGPPNPFVVGMFGYAIVHDAGDNLKRVFKRFHRFTSGPLAIFGQGIAAPYCGLLTLLSAS